MPYNMTFQLIDFAFLDLENTQLQETRGSVLDNISEGRFFIAL